MNSDELFRFHEVLCAEALGLMRRKNHDYAGSGGDTPFLNLQLSEKLGLVSTEVGMAVRLSDKIQRLCHGLSKPYAVSDESMRDTIVDIINYSVLILAYQQDKKATETDISPAELNCQPASLYETHKDSLSAAMGCFLHGC